MKISRRDFLKYCSLFAAAVGLSSLQLERLGSVLANPNGPSIIWLNGASCSGCSVSFLNTLNQTTDAAGVLVESINLIFHPEFMAAAGDLAVKAIRTTFEKGDYILIVEGGIPTAYAGKSCMLWTENGQEVTCVDAVKELATRALQVIALGSCAAFGGVSAAGTNPLAVKSVSAILGSSSGSGSGSGTKSISLPGCPIHPDMLVATLVKILNQESFELDSFARPKFLYDKTIHSLCALRGKPMANTYGIAETCLMGLGCRGPKTRFACPTRLWNEGVNWCVGAGSPCLGCVEESFPGKGPLLRRPSV
ncbi:MAG: hydrogenase small subunit [Oligoflexia bacterium]|nr:hydrogenase small subunit [Oligoflexia bacterium]MBF0364052.1 hydrogenase small subunit [Oligoflexia bacterium]